MSVDQYLFPANTFNAVYTIHIMVHLQAAAQEVGWTGL